MLNWNVLLFIIVVRVTSSGSSSDISDLTFVIAWYLLYDFVTSCTLYVMLFFYFFLCCCRLFLNILMTLCLKRHAAIVYIFSVGIIHFPSLNDSHSLFFDLSLQNNFLIYFVHVFHDRRGGCGMFGHLSLLL